MGSALDFVDTLTILTTTCPTVWTEHYKSKTTVDRRLRQFFKKGSQLGPSSFWDRLVDLFKALPRDILPTNAADAAELLNALHGGIARKDESRINLDSAFKTYLFVANSVGSSLSNEDQNTLQNEMVLPLIAQFLQPTPENAQWNMPQQSTHLISTAISSGNLPAIMETKWPEYMQQLIKDIKTSAPEQSKDHEKSQQSLVKQAARFAIVQEQALKTPSGASLRQVFSDAYSSLLSEALLTIKNRNGKPYGATGAVAEFLHRNRELVLNDDKKIDQLETFIKDDLPELLLSPSSAYLVDILYSLSELPSFKTVWTAALKAVLKAPDTPTKSKALEAILTSSKIPKSFDLASEDIELQQYIKTNVEGAIEGLLEWDSFYRILQSPARILSSDTTDEVLSKMTASMSLSAQAPYAIQGLRHIVRQDPGMLKAFISTPQGSKLLQGLLLASESPNEEIAQGASAVNASIQTVLAAGTDSQQSVYDLIQQGLQEATPTSVSVETLVELAKQLIKPGSTWEGVQPVFPKLESWSAALDPFLNAAPRTSLAIANPLAGAIYLVKPNQPASSTLNLARDADGYSAAYRIAMYVARLFKENLYSFEELPNELQATYLTNIALTIQLADDNHFLAGANGLWIEYNADTEADAAAFVSDAQSFVTQEYTRLQKQASENDNSLLNWAERVSEGIPADTSAQSYYSARAQSVLLAHSIDKLGWKNTDTPQMQELLKTVRKSKGEKAANGYLLFANMESRTVHLALFPQCFQRTTRRIKIL
jgi:hypothetical protein